MISKTPNRIKMIPIYFGNLENKNRNNPSPINKILRIKNKWTLNPNKYINGSFINHFQLSDRGKTTLNNVLFWSPIVESVFPSTSIQS